MEPSFPLPPLLYSRPDLSQLCWVWYPAGRHLAAGLQAAACAGRQLAGTPLSSLSVTSVQSSGERIIAGEAGTDVMKPRPTSHLTPPIWVRDQTRKEERKREREKNECQKNSVWIFSACFAFVIVLTLHSIKLCWGSRESNGSPPPGGILQELHLWKQGPGVLFSRLP